MDVAQFLDFMLGSASAVSKTSQQETRNKLLDKATKDLRSVIEDTLPAVYLVKAYEIANNLLVGLGSMNEAELAKYVSHIIDPIHGPIGPAEEGFDEAFGEAYDSLVVDLDNIAKQLIQALNKRINKDITIASLSKEVTRINSIIDKASNSYAVTLSLGTDQDTSNVTNVLRSEIVKAGSELRNYLSRNTPARFADANQILSTYNESNELLIVGSSFSALTSLVNDISSPIIRDWLEKHSIKPTNKLTVGQFTAAGHVAVVSKENEIKKIIGINTPLTQSTLVYASQQAKQNITMDTFVLDSTHIDCALEINKESDSFKNLLSLNFSFLMSQEAAFNSVTLRSAEVKAMDSIVKKVFNTSRENLKTAFLKRIVSKQGLDYLVSALRFSPTLKESITLQVLNSLQGTKTAKILATGTAKNKGISSKTSLTSAEINKAIKKIANTISKPSTKSRNKKPAPSITYSLASLQLLLNTHLQDVISANMGSGSSRDILNYRTGRFAASAKVEKISQSREGMITAFYSYMKNPYQTFEPGFRQGSPKSRDPKLLIAKSIRDIAATKVANRMRAVVI